ncbi:MAG: protein kinase [Gordonia sp. (in: high G+C Gram-positive bacteria)]
MTLEPGDEFAGYRIIEVLGTGGMGTVYRVTNANLARDEALKTVRPTTGIPAADERFRREAHAAANLSHPSIVTIHKFDVTDDTPWYTMEYLRGDDLAKVAGRLPAHEVTEIIGRVGQALDYAHSRSVIHRDVKPGNIILTRGPGGLLDRVVLVDFGIVKNVAQPTQLTQPYQPLGSPPYMAPELIRGEPATAASDQYALAVTAFQALTGHTPFAGSTGELLAAHATAPPPSITRHRPDLSAADQALSRALAKDPAQRFGSCAEFADALGYALAGASRDAVAPPTLPPPTTPPVTTYPPPPTTYGPHPYGAAPLPPPPKKRRKGLYAALAALLVVVAGTTGGVLWHRANQAPPQRADWHLANPAGVKPGAWTKLATESNTHGPRSVCGINDGEAYCWGESNDMGQLGKVGAPAQFRKVENLVKPVIDIAVGPDFACAIHDDGRLTGCWGRNNGRMDAPRPATMPPPAKPSKERVTAISVASIRGCLIKTGKPKCWGKLNLLSDNPADIQGSMHWGPTDVSVFGEVVQVATRPSTMCVVAKGGTVKCQGTTTDGRMDDRVTDVHAQPTNPIVAEMPILKDIVEVEGSSVGFTWCARSKAKVYCWGSGGDGLLGNGDERFVNSPPIPVEGLTNPTSLSGGMEFFCAAAEGSAYCWGTNSVGQNGNDQPGVQTATKVEGVHNVTSVIAGREFACALADGERYCWGKPPVQ